MVQPDEATTESNPSDQAPQSPSDVNGFDQVLEFINLCRGVEGSLITSDEGLVVSSWLPDEVSADQLAPWVTALQEASQDCISQMNQGETEQLVVNTTYNLLVILRVWRFRLLVLAKKGAALDFIQMRLGQAVSMLKTSLEKRYGALIPTHES